MLRVLSESYDFKTSSRKGGPCLIKASDDLRSRDRTLHLTIAGRGPVTSELARAVEASDWLHLVTSPSDQELDRLYLQSDVFVLATRTGLQRGAQSGEGFGIVLVEAVLAGLPVIAPAFGGSADAYLEGGDRHAAWR